MHFNIEVWYSYEDDLWYLMCNNRAIASFACADDAIRERDRLAGGT